MAFGTKVQFEELRSLAFGSISGSYAAVGSATTDHARLVCFTNATNADLYISLDGITNHLIVPANGFKLLDLTANKVRDDGLFISKETIFYTKQVSAPSSGSLWIEVMYASGGI